MKSGKVNISRLNQGKMIIRKAANSVARFLIVPALAIMLFSQAQAQGDQSLRGKLEQAIEVASQNQLKIIGLTQTELPVFMK
jgi:hypothetical protein